MSHPPASTATPDVPAARRFPTFEAFLAHVLPLQLRVQREVYGFSEAEIAERNQEPERSEDFRAEYESLWPDAGNLGALLALRWNPAMVTNRTTKAVTQARREAAWRTFAAATLDLADRPRRPRPDQA